MATTPTNPLILVEVIPLINSIITDNNDVTSDGVCKAANTNKDISRTISTICPPISAPLAKMQLLNMSRQGMFSKGWLNMEQKKTAGKGRGKNRRGKNKPDPAVAAEVIMPSKRGLWLRTDYSKLESSSMTCEYCQKEGNTLQSQQEIKQPDDDGRAGFRKLAISEESDSSVKNKETENTIFSNIANIKETLQIINTCDFSGRVISGDLLFQGKDGGFNSKGSIPLFSPCDNSSIAVVYLKSDDPLDELGVPCLLRGYTFANNMNKRALDQQAERCSRCKCGESSSHADLLEDKCLKCIVSNGTAVQILSPLDIAARHSYSDGQKKTSCMGYNLHKFLSGKDNIADDIQCRVRIKSQASERSMNQDLCEIVATTPSLPYSKLSSYDPETVESLVLRMATMLENTVWIGTSPHAVSCKKIRKTDLQSMDEELLTFWKSDPSSNTSYFGDVTNKIVNKNPTKMAHLAGAASVTNTNGAVPLLLREGALLIYNSHPNSGKTTLVSTIAKNVLKFDAVHVLSAPALFAKYGTSADMALETILHELALRGALRGGATFPFGDPTIDCHQVCPTCNLLDGQHNSKMNNGEKGKVCIILDHFETFLPPPTSIGGDPYLPVLNSMASFLSRLSFSLKAKSEFPFPSNPLYNIFDSDGSTPGFSIPLGFCLVGVVTCSDDRGRPNNNIERMDDGGVFRNALDALGGGRLLVPLPSATTRLLAFRHAFDAVGIMLNESAQTELPEVAAKATWASGGDFLGVAKKLKSKLDVFDTSVATEQDLRSALIAFGRNQFSPASKKATYTADFPSLGTTSGPSMGVSFTSVGGNKDAKLALEDALALDPKKRHLLESFGLQAPTGVLLYGPPGTGKTLLARAVAQSLYSKNSMDVGKVGGAFISLKASDVVRPEVGNSEKMIVSAFETARSNAPSVVFIDEFQALFGDRGGSGFILGQLASTLLQCMDDITRWSQAKENGAENRVQTETKNSRIVVLGATNTPWMIDKAFLRPGRFDRAVHVGLPNTDEREDILRVHTLQMKLAPLDDGSSPADKICKQMANLCLGFSGADLAALCRAAAVRCLSKKEGVTCVTGQHFVDAFMHDVVRSSNNELVRRISSWQP